MNKSAELGHMRVAAIPETWRAATGNPLGSAAAVYGLGALATYAAYPWLANKFTDYAGTGDEREDEEMRKELLRKRKHVALLLPFLPAAAHLYGMMDLRQNNAKPFYGLTSWHDKAPETLAKTASVWGSGAALGSTAARSMSSWGTDDGPGFDAIMNQPSIPFDFSRRLVHKDPVLNDDQKGRVLNVFNSAPRPDHPDWLSPSNLAVGAIRAGAGFLAGSLAGKAMGSLFSLPKPVTSKLSVTGGIGGALINMGVV